MDNRGVLCTSSRSPALIAVCVGCLGGAFFLQGNCLVAPRIHFASYQPTLAGIRYPGFPLEQINYLSLRVILFLSLASLLEDRGRPLIINQQAVCYEIVQLIISIPLPGKSIDF